MVANKLTMTTTESRNHIELVLKIARMYYTDNLTQAQIAAQVGYSRPHHLAAAQRIARPGHGTHRDRASTRASDAAGGRAGKTVRVEMRTSGAGQSRAGSQHHRPPICRGPAYRKVVARLAHHRLQRTGRRRHGPRSRHPGLAEIQCGADGGRPLPPAIR